MADDVMQQTSAAQKQVINDIHADAVAGDGIIGGQGARVDEAGDGERQVFNHSYAEEGPSAAYRAAGDDGYLTLEEYAQMQNVQEADARQMFAEQAMTDLPHLRYSYACNQVYAERQETLMGWMESRDKAMMEGQPFTEPRPSWDVSVWDEVQGMDDTQQDMMARRFMYDNPAAMGMAAQNEMFYQVTHAANERMSNTLTNVGETFKQNGEKQAQSASETLNQAQKGMVDMFSMNRAAAVLAASRLARTSPALAAVAMGVMAYRERIGQTLNAAMAASQVNGMLPNIYDATRQMLSDAYKNGYEMGRDDAQKDATAKDKGLDKQVANALNPSKKDLANSISEKFVQPSQAVKTAGTMEKGASAARGAKAASVVAKAGTKAIPGVGQVLMAAEVVGTVGKGVNDKMNASVDKAVGDALGTSVDSQAVEDEKGAGEQAFHGRQLDSNLAARLGLDNIARKTAEMKAADAEFEDKITSYR